MRVLVTGGRGMLGSDICDAFAQHGDDAVAVGSTDFDITDEASTRSFIGDLRPGLVVHCAAYTDVEGCSRHPERAQLVNATGAGNVAAASQAAGAQIIAISTDFVFDGLKGSPYVEEDTPAPCGVYGASKLAGEERVQAECEHHKIVRTSWLFGAHGRCFPCSMIAAAEAGRPLSVVDDQSGSPTYTRDLANWIVQLAGVPQDGIYHLANSGVCTWFDLALEAVQLAGISDAVVLPIPSSAWATETQRPKYSPLDTHKWQQLGNPEPRDWHEALAEFVPEIEAS